MPENITSARRHASPPVARDHDDAAPEGQRGRRRPERRLRVLITVKKRGWNGETCSILDVVRGTVAAGYDVLVAARRDSEMRTRATGAGATVVDLELVHSPTALGALRRDLARLRRVLATVDVVHTHASWDTWLVAAARSMLRAPPPMLRTRHNLKGIRPHAPNRWLYGRAITCLVAPSRTIALDLARYGFIGADRVCSILSGIDLEQFDTEAVDRVEARRDLRARCAASADAPVVAYVSRIVERKRPGIFLDVAERLRDVYPSARFVLAGEFSGAPDWQQALRRRARSLHPHAQFLGFERDVPRLLAGADVFVLPAPTEPFGLATLEAAAMRCPAVGPRAAGLAETVVHGETGLLFRPDDSDDCAAAVARLLADPDLRRRMGEAARLRTHALYDARRMIREHLDLYAALAATGAQSKSRSSDFSVASPAAS